MTPLDITPSDRLTKVLELVETLFYKKQITFAGAYIKKSGEVVCSLGVCVRLTDVDGSLSGHSKNEKGDIS